MKNIFAVLICGIMMLLNSCDHNELTYPQPEKNEFIIIGGGQKGFTAINIYTSQRKNIPAVLELGGRMYLPIFSSLPSFNKKIVEGVFVPDTNYYLSLRDTIFHVTKHLRDTTIATVGK